MIHFVPDYISANSAAEERLFRLMQGVQLDEDWYCFHSLNLPYHIYKRNGEIDFLLLGPTELFCLEVKGGAIACENGIWKYTDRYGVAHQSAEGPFRQAQSAMYSLRERLRQGILPEPEAGLLFGYGVVFPDHPFAVSSVEWNREVVLNERQMSEKGFVDFLARLRQYWGERQALPTGLSEELSCRLRQFLRPDFEMIPSLRSRLGTTEEQVISLTEEQYRLIDSLASMPRLLCRGGAGTGKTLLALQTAHRHAALGRRVLLLCASPLLAAVLRTRARDDRIRVCAIGEFRHRSFRDKSGELSLPYWAANSAFDVLIVDEGQDVLTFSHLELFDTVLAGGMERGRWYIFFDPENQGGVYGEMDPDVVELLESYHPGTPELSFNCRNTDRIISRTELLTGIPAGKPRIQSREQVETHWYSTPEQEVQGVQVLVQKLIHTERVAPGDLTILTLRSVLELSPVGRSALSRRSDVRTLDERSLPEFPFRTITLAAARTFKGLDNVIVILTDIDDLEDASLFYVALTRARSKLYLFVNENMREEIIRRMDRFISDEVARREEKDASTDGGGGTGTSGRIP